MEYDFYPDIRFQCQCCDFDCCSKFEVTVTLEECERIKRLGLANIPSWDQCFSPTENGRILIVNKDPATGTCVFSDGRRCRIHAQFGYHAKPLCCRVFPLHIQHWKDGHASVEYRYICPAVGRNSGRSLAENRPSLERLVKEMIIRIPPDETVYSAINPAGLKSVRQIHHAFLGILHNQDLPFRLCCYAVQRILDFQHSKGFRSAIKSVDETFATDAIAFMDKASNNLFSELDAGRIDSLTNTNFRSILCGYLRDDDSRVAHGLCFRMERMFRQFMIVTGSGLLSDLNPNAPIVPGRLLPFRTDGDKLHGNSDAWSVFKRYFFGKADSMHFCGRMVHGFNYEDGLRHLLLVPVVAFSLAGALAWQKRKKEIDGDDMLKTVRLIDFTFARSPFFRLRSARRWIKQLSAPAVYAGLLKSAL